MKVSICISTYERKEFLQEAIESCLDQTVAPYEVLIGDDSKTDITEMFIKKVYLNRNLPTKIRYFRNKPALGQCENINFLMAQARGDKLMLLHDDDLFLKNAVEDLSRCFEDNEGIVVAFGKQYLISDKGSLLQESSVSLNEIFFRTKKYEGIQESSVLSGVLQQLPNNAYMIDTNIAREVGVSDGAGQAVDFYFGFRLGLMQKKFYFLNKYTAKYRLSLDSIVRAYASDDTAFQAVRLVFDHAGNGLYDINDLKINSWIYNKMPLAISQGILTGNRLTALRWFFSPYYRRRILSFSGAKRLLMFIAPVFIALKINRISSSMFELQSLPNQTLAEL